MNKAPKFSIIVPVYNVERYLSFCLASIIEQSLKDIEIICVNDGSTDNSLQILYEFAKRDDRIQIINKENGGLSSARNAGLKIASGKYILFVDSDDMISKDMCDRLYREVLQKESDIIVFSANIFPENWTATDKAWLEWNLQVSPTYYVGNCIKALFEERASKPFVWDKCIRNEWLRGKQILFDERILFGEDMIFLFEIFSRAGSVSYIPDKLYWYRYDREGSLMDISRKDMEWKLNMHLKIIRKILQDWDSNGMIEGNEEGLYIWCLEFVLEEISQVPQRKSREAICSRLKVLLQTYHVRPRKKDKHIKNLEERLYLNIRGKGNNGGIREVSLSHIKVL